LPRGGHRRWEGCSFLERVGKEVHRIFEGEKVEKGDKSKSVNDWDQKWGTGNGHEGEGERPNSFFKIKHLSAPRVSHH